MKQPWGDHAALHTGHRTRLVSLAGATRQVRRRRARAFTVAGGEVADAAEAAVEAAVGDDVVRDGLLLQAAVACKQADRSRSVAWPLVLVTTHTACGCCCTAACGRGCHAMQVMVPSQECMRAAGAPVAALPGLADSACHTHTLPDMSPMTRT